MEEGTSSNTLTGTIKGIRFGLATRKEIVKSSISDCPINHPSQLLNPFLGLPLESGKCESCGTAEPGKCEGHFGYIELPIPIYHPDHVTELKRMLSLLCLKCLKLKNRMVKQTGVLERMFSSCCEEVAQIAVNEVKNSEGASYLELKLPKNSEPREDFWSFMEKFGFRYGEGFSRRLLPSEVMVMLKKIPEGTRKKLSAKGFHPQEGYILQYLPVPPNCLSVPDISDGMNIMSSDHSITMLKKVLKQIENIKSSRSGTPNFEAHDVEACDLQVSVAQYLEFRGTGKASRDVDRRYGVAKESNDTTTKAWLEKMKTLFIRKGSGFSSRSVITGDPYKGIAEIGLPFEIAQRITFQERVSMHNVSYLQKLVDEKLCLTFRDGSSTYSLREGSKGHTFLRPGQLVHRRIMDGDIVFINRPPTTHKHSLQALSVYVHDDHTVKINPLICGPLSADFDGDCIHLFYPQSLAAKAEVVELFSVEKQLLSSHTGNFILQIGSDSLLALKLMFENYFFNKACAQQLAMFLPSTLPKPAVVKSHIHWTTLQLLEAALPRCFDGMGDRYTINNSEVLRMDYGKDTVSSTLNDIISSIYFAKGPKEVIRFFNALQPLLMEYLYTKGFSISLGDFFISKAASEKIQRNIQGFSNLLKNLRSSYNESVELQLERLLRVEKNPVTTFALRSSVIGHLIDPKSESGLNKVVQQIGFLGLQISDRGKFYTKTLVNDVAQLFKLKYPSAGYYPSEEFGMVSNCLVNGLDPYQEMVHSISSREVIVRSTRGLTEPGTLFKNLMAILRDVVICYDGTVRNICSNSIIQFEYGANHQSKFQSEFGAGDPVGVLAATAMSNPAYKAVLDSSPSSNSSWEMMKEILLCGARFKNDLFDRRVILYLNHCGCGRKHCTENAAYLVKNHLRKVCLKDAAVEFLIAYERQQTVYELSGLGAFLVGHIHLNKEQLENLDVDLDEILEKCQEKVSSLRRKKKIALLFRRIELSFSACCSCDKSKSRSSEMPCLRFSWPLDTTDDHLERTAHILVDTICPVLLETVIKGDPRVSTASIIWSSPETMTWIRSSSNDDQQGELAIEVILEKEAVKQSGDAWRIVIDSCLPILHLIDTRRSIPYAIKQVQELLGISCAFEQAVQRLSTSVTMVTKGVLKDHLLLLANSMTCAGNMVGFNAGGIKALSRSLNVQIPFAEATLFTPRKCFERAAEKCHVDSLTSVVASCSWGKHVAVGTGSSFEILLDTRKVELNQQEGQNVYDFLLLMRSGHAQEEKGTDCLGAEIDDLFDEDMELYLSPERDSELTKPTFEDGIDDLNNNFGEGQPSSGGWDTASAGTLKTDGGGGWDKASADTSKQDSWSSWGGKKAEEGGKDSAQPDSGSSGWGSKKQGDDGFAQPDSGSWGEATQSKPWGKNVDGGEGFAQAASGSWGNATKSNSWEKNVEGGDAQPATGSWGKTTETQSNSWGKKVEGDGGFAQPATESWGKKTQTNSWGKNVEGNDSFAQPATGSWGKETQTANDSTEGSWGKKSTGGWGSPKVGTGDSGQSQWGKQKNVSTNDNWKSGGWGSPKVGTGDSGQSQWGKQKNVSTNDNWKSGGVSEEKSNDSAGGWGSPPVARDSAQSQWGKQKNVSTNDSWKSQSVAEEKSNDSAGGWGSPPVSARDSEQSQWGKPKNVSTNDSWKSKSVTEEKSNDSAGGWGSPKVGASDNVQSQWGSQKRTNDSWKSQGVSEEKSNDSAGGWGSPKVGPGDSGGGWGSTKVSASDGGQSQWDSQSTPKADTNASKRGWGSAGSQDEQKNESSGGAGGWSSKGGGDWGSAVPRSPASQGADSPTWTSTTTPDQRGNESGGGGGGGWVPRKRKGDGNERGWGSAKGDGNEGSRNWGSGGGGGDWKNRRNRPPKPTDDSNVGVAFTVTRQRLDKFTEEESDILKEVEPIMERIRKTMHQSGVTDGEPLSADDQAYIIDNVVNHHPDKASKIGAGIDYLMVSKHSSFQDTRCLYVVSTDGAKQDFSYRKCLENFVRIKYPDKAEAFIQKYFVRKAPFVPRPGWRRDNNATQEAVTQESPSQDPPPASTDEPSTEEPKASS